MGQDVLLYQKLANIKCQRVKVESFLSAPEDEENEVANLHDEGKDSYALGGLNSNGKLEEQEPKFGDFGALLGNVEVGGLDATNGQSSSCDDYILNVEYGGKPANLSYDPLKRSGFVNSSFESQSPGFSGCSNGATGISESLTETVPISHCIYGAYELRSEVPGEGSNCPALINSENLNEFDNDGGHLIRGTLCNEHSKSYGGASEDAASSRGRRLRKPTRRYIEEYSEPKSETFKGKAKPSSSATKTKLRKFGSSKESRYPKPKGQASFQGRDSVSGIRTDGPRKLASVQVFQPEDKSTYSDSEDDHMTKRSKKCDRRKHQRMWTLSEVMKLVDGIATHGTGRWTDIKRHLFASSDYRTPIDLRDKWRNLLRASRVLKQNKKGVEQMQIHVTRPLPKSLLHRVCELAKLHPYPKERSSKSSGTVPFAAEDDSFSSVRRRSIRREIST